MKINLEKILKHAESKLQISPENQNQDWVKLFKQFLKVENHRLLMAHRYGADGLEIAQDRSYLMDILIQHIYELARQEYQLKSKAQSPVLSIVALGGYGREELNPYSDIDILFLLKNKPDESIDELIKRILYLLWDIGLKVGHATRTIPETIEAGRRDLKSRTSMMEARFITGDRDLYDQFQKIFLEKCLAKDVSTYIEQKIQEIHERHEKFKGTVYLQEPQIKEGVGGLRDLSSILWLYRTLYGYRTFPELAQHKILSPKDLKIVERTLNFLHRVRNEMHFSTGKCTDILSLALQPRIAKNLGYQNTALLKISESFMKDYYQHARNAHQFAQNLLSRDEIQTQFKIRFPQKFIERDGFAFTEEEIFPGNNPNLFRENPLKLFEVFLYCAHGNYKISQSLTQEIRKHLFLVDKKIQTSPKARDIFISIMSYEGSILRALRSMHDTGLLGKYIPEFGKATCFVQHDLYHKYTLDEHTLKALGFLDELKITQDIRLDGFATVFKEITQRDVAFLSVFFHDIGKIEGKDHSIKGAQIVEEILERIQYDKEKIQRIKFLIENHILMAHISQRRDLSEEKIIVDFSKKIGDVENLRILHLLTYADSRATGEEIWNEWKEALLWELYYKTRRYLLEKTVLLPSEVQAIKNSYLEILTKRNLPKEKVLEHLDMLPVSYVQAYRPETVMEHLKIISEIDKTNPGILWSYHERTNTTELTVCTKDKTGLFSEIAGTIASQDVNILNANIFTRNDGIVIDRFSLENPYEKAILPEKVRIKLEENLTRVLQSHSTVKELLVKRVLSQGETPSPKNPPIIKFDNETSLNTTIVEIQTDDQLGFLYKVTRTFSRLGLDIHFAKIATEKAQIYDVFYITGPDNRKILQPEALEKISHEIEKAILSPIEAL